MSITVEIKWGNNIYKNVTIDFNEDPSDFKARLFSLTNVPPDRQKLMLKGGALKDTWAPFKNSLKTGQRLMLTGTADPIIDGPKKETIFLEDLPEEEQAGALYPPGLKNLGNTCYMNSSLQCLHSVDELKEPLSKFVKIGANTPEASMVSAARDLWRQIGGSRASVAPEDFWRQLRINHVRFDEQVKPGVFQQHDAEEFWSILLSSLRAKLPSSNSQNFIETLFGIEMEEKYTGLDDKEDIVNKQSDHTKLICTIDEKVSHTSESLERLFGLSQTAEKEVLELFSSKLGRQSHYVKDSRISKLPNYLTLQYARFFIKRKEGEVISVKINKLVEIPVVLDMYKFCTPKLQSTLKREIIDIKTNKDKKIEVEEKKEENGEESKEMAVEEPKRMTGVYDLWAVLTHQGRSLQGGHYVAFVRQSADENDWLLFDDDKVKPKNLADIKNLSGGGADSPIAYMCFFKARFA